MNGKLSKKHKKMAINTIKDFLRFATDEELVELLEFIIIDMKRKSL